MPLATVRTILQEGNAEASSRKLRYQFQQASEAQHVLETVQDYLADPTAGRVDGKVPTLRKLLGSTPDLTYGIPPYLMLRKVQSLEKLGAAAHLGKSPVAAKREGRQRARQKLLASRSLEELSTAVRELQSLTPEVGSLPEQERELRQIAAQYQELKRGNIDIFDEITSDLRDADRPEIIRSFQLQLIVYALPRVLSLPAEESLTPGETPFSFLHRIRTQAAEQRDWALVERTVTTLEKLEGIFGRDMAVSFAFERFLAGVNQERARQFSLAVTSYLVALDTKSELIPGQQIKDMLAAIKKEHPAEYEAGVRSAKAGAVGDRSKGARPKAAR
jgi:hypothetical protein